MLGAILSALAEDLLRMSPADSDEELAPEKVGINALPPGVPMLAVNRLMSRLCGANFREAFRIESKEDADQASVSDSEWMAGMIANSQGRDQAAAIHLTNAIFAISQRTIEYERYEAELDERPDPYPDSPGAKTTASAGLPTWGTGDGTNGPSGHMRIVN